MQIKNIAFSLVEVVIAFSIIGAVSVIALSAFNKSANIDTRKTEALTRDFYRQFNDTFDFYIAAQNSMKKDINAEDEGGAWRFPDYLVEKMGAKADEYCETHNFHDLDNIIKKDRGHYCLKFKNHIYGKFYLAAKDRIEDNLPDDQFNCLLTIETNRVQRYFNQDIGNNDQSKKYCAAFVYEYERDPNNFYIIPLGNKNSY